jgi:predicted O-methyltransferase YrrM
MTQDRWTAVDRYIDGSLVKADVALDAVLEESAAAGLPAISVSPAQGKLLFVLARAMGARRILELGTLGGYSGIWLAHALPPGGRLVTIEVDPAHAAVARRSFERAGVSPLIDLRLGAALDVLPRLAAEGGAPFDLVFIDADKGNYAEYLDWAVRLCRPGSLIVADNVVRHGEVIDAASDDPGVQGIRRFITALEADTRVTATAIQTVGVKGYDGFAAIVVTGSVDRSGIHSPRGG